jgi:hypothetical protein
VLDIWVAALAQLTRVGRSTEFKSPLQPFDLVFTEITAS